VRNPRLSSPDNHGDLSVSGTRPGLILRLILPSQLSENAYLTSIFVQFGKGLRLGVPFGSGFRLYRSTRPGSTEKLGPPGSWAYWAVGPTGQYCLRLRPFRPCRPVGVIIVLESFCRKTRPAEEPFCQGI
jgi:hypothetical protein